MKSDSYTPPANYKRSTNGKSASLHGWQSKIALSHFNCASFHFRFHSSVGISRLSCAIAFRHGLLHWKLFLYTVGPHLVHVLLAQIQLCLASKTKAEENNNLRSAGDSSHYFTYCMPWSEPGAAQSYACKCRSKSHSIKWFFSLASESRIAAWICCSLSRSHFLPASHKC